MRRLSGYHRPRQDQRSGVPILNKIPLVSFLFERKGNYVSNRKLLRLAEVGKAIKDKYGSKDKLVAALSQALGKAKDKDYVARLKNYSSARLLDMARGADRRVRRTKKAKAAS